MKQRTMERHIDNANTKYKGGLVGFSFSLIRNCRSVYGKDHGFQPMNTGVEVDVFGVWCLVLGGRLEGQRLTATMNL